ncbi:MAG: hypothetical protein HQM09_18050 [Candidatus Riflebacteria bacterium]|nr:hypothetical protein [Candidatus Riflebacteria bacterium]
MSRPIFACLLILVLSNLMGSAVSGETASGIPETALAATTGSQTTVAPTASDILSAPAATSTIAPPSAPGGVVTPTEPESLRQIGSGSPREDLTEIPSEAESPLRVAISLYLNQLGKINDQNESFEAVFDLQQRWRDPRLKFDPIENGSDRRMFINEKAEAQLKKMWSPGLQIRNLSGKPTRVEYALFLNANGSICYRQRVRGAIEAKFRMRPFPFDVQDLPITIVSPEYTINDIALVQDQSDRDSSGFRKGMSASGFKARELFFSAGRERGLTGLYHPTFEGKLVVARDPTSHLFIIFTPLLALLVIPTLLTLYSKVDIAPRLTAWATSVLALIALNFTYSAKYPAVGSDSLINTTVTIGFGYQVCMIAISLFILYQPMAEKLSGKLGNKHVVPEIERHLKWAIPIGFLTLLLGNILLTKYLF